MEYPLYTYGPQDDYNRTPHNANVNKNDGESIQKV